MIVSELIEILKKCDPTANTYFCYADNERAASVEFLEFDTTNNNIFFYEDEPSWENDSSLDECPELNTIVLAGDRLAKTTYLKPLIEINLPSAS